MCTVQRLVSQGVTTIAFSAEELSDLRVKNVKLALSSTLNARAPLGLPQHKLKNQHKMTQKSALSYDINFAKRFMMAQTGFWGKNVKQSIKDAGEEKWLAGTASHNKPGTSSY